MILFSEKLRKYNQLVLIVLSVVCSIITTLFKIENDSPRFLLDTNFSCVAEVNITFTTAHRPSTITPVNLALKMRKYLFKHIYSQTVLGIPEGSVFGSVTDIQIILKPDVSVESAVYVNLMLKLKILLGHAFLVRCAKLMGKRGTGIILKEEAGIGWDLDILYGYIEFISNDVQEFVVMYSGMANVNVARIVGLEGVGGVSTNLRKANAVYCDSVKEALHAEEILMENKTECLTSKDKEKLKKVKIDSVDMCKKCEALKIGREDIRKNTFQLLNVYIKLVKMMI